MKIGFIGAGKVGQSLGIDLYRKGCYISGYYSLHYAHAEIAAAAVEANAYDQLEELIKDSDIIFVTVNDDAIQLVVSDIKSHCEVDFHKKIIAHTSGVHASDELKPLDTLGAGIYAMHPIQSFASVEQALTLLSGTVFSLEGSGISSSKGEPKALDMHGEKMLTFMNKTGYDYFVMKAKDKARYHAAAVISSNYLVATLDFALNQFEQIGCSKAFAMKALFPLIQGTIDNIDRLGTVGALTGPIARGDVATVAKHLACFKDDERMLYKSLGLQTLKIANEKGLDASKYDQLFNLLKED